VLFMMSVKRSPLAFENPMPSYVYGAGRRFRHVDVDVTT